MIPWLLVLALGCRPDPGAPVYPEIGPWEDTANPTLDGFEAYEDGDERLAFGIFYEGEASEESPIDGTNTFYFIYQNTYSQGVTEERIEGSFADKLTLGSGAFWGGGIHWASPRDLSGWSTLHLGLLATDPSFESLEVGVKSSTGETRLLVADYGFAADGTWRRVQIPLADLESAGANLSSVEIPLMMIALETTAGAEMLIDDVYIAGEGS